MARLWVGERVRHRARRRCRGRQTFGCGQDNLTVRNHIYSTRAEPSVYSTGTVGHIFLLCAVDSKRALDKSLANQDSYS